MMPLPSLVVAALVHTSPLGRMVFTILTACGAAVSGYGVGLLWRDRTRVFDGPAAVWPYSEALWKGWVRSLPAQNVGFWAGVVLVRYGMWGPSDRGTGRVVVIAILAVAAGALAVAITVAGVLEPAALRRGAASALAARCSGRVARQLARPPRAGLTGEHHDCAPAVRTPSEPR